MNIVTGIAVGVLTGYLVSLPQAYDRQAIQQCFKDSPSHEIFQSCIMYSFYDEYKKAMGIK
jgi:hypothetical protein